MILFICSFFLFYVLCLLSWVSSCFKEGEQIAQWLQHTLHMPMSRVQSPAVPSSFRMMHMWDNLYCVIRSFDLHLSNDCPFQLPSNDFPKDRFAQLSFLESFLGFAAASIFCQMNCHWIKYLLRWLNNSISSNRFLATIFQKATLFFNGISCIIKDIIM